MYSLDFTVSLTFSFSYQFFYRLSRLFFLFKRIVPFTFPAIFIELRAVWKEDGLSNIGFRCDALRDLVPFVQFKKREKYPWRSVNFSKVAGFTLQLY